MERLPLADLRMEQLRAVENALLNPECEHPEDPTVSFEKDIIRASTLPGFNFLHEPLKFNLLDSLLSTHGPLRRQGRPGRTYRHQPIDAQDGRRRHGNENPIQRPAPLEIQNPNFVPNEVENVGQNEPNNDPRRPLSPTQLPGVRAIPKEYNRAFRGFLTPGDFFAKSHTRYLGPFDELPTAERLPAGDNYILLQRMGRLPESGKSIFRQVGSLLT